MKWPMLLQQRKQVFITEDVILLLIVSAHAFSYYTQPWNSSGVSTTSMPV